MFGFRILVYCVFVHEIVGNTRDDVNNLLTELFTTYEYNKKVRPVADQATTVYVEVEFVLNAVIEFDEQEEVLKTAGYLVLQWTDDYLSWDESSFNNTNLLFIPQDDIWKPDISLRNTYKSFTGLGSSYLNVNVNSNGSVHWNPFQILESTCSVDITYFPFDKQICDMKFTAWSYQKAEVDLNAGRQGVTLEDFSPNAQWDLTKTSYKEVNTGESSVIFQIELTRKSSFYVINVIAPVILLSVLNVCTFFLPVTSGEKASYAVTVFLSLAVFLTIIASELPKNSDVVSLLSVYLMLMSSLSTFIVVVCLIQLRLSVRTTSETPINWAFLFLIKVSMIMRCKKCSEKVSPPSKKIHVTERIIEKDNSDTDNRYNWINVIDAIDVVLFWASLLFTILCTAIIFGISVNIH